MKKSNSTFVFPLLFCVLGIHLMHSQLKTNSNNKKENATEEKKLKQTSYPTFELFIKNENNEHSTKVFYVAGKTTGFDNGYDSKIFGATTYDLAIFTELITDNEGNKLAIQTLPNENYETMVVPVGIIGKAGYEITLSVVSLNLPENLNIYLEDKVNNVFINLSETEHQTTLSNDTSSTGQFYIHTKTPESLSTKDIEQTLNNLKIYKSSDQEITITNLEIEANFKLFSSLGKEITSTTLQSTEKTKISFPKIAHGMYTVQLIFKNGVKFTKKMIF